MVKPMPGRGDAPSSQISRFSASKTDKITCMTADASLPPTVRADWIGGHFRTFRRDPTAFLTRMAALGDVSTFRMGKIRVFLINNPEMIRDLLVTSHHKFVKGRALQRAKTLLGEGLLTSERDFHLRQRRMIQPTFHRARINDYAVAMIDLAEQMAAEWRGGETVDVDREMMRLTLRIVGRTLFSANVDDEADEVGKAMTTIVSAFNFILLPFSEYLENLPIPPIRRLKNARQTLDDVIYRIIDERRVSGEDKGDLLSMLLMAQDEETGGAMTDKQVRDEALTLFLAGHETTANALIWTFYLLSQNPEIERRLHVELDEVLGDRELQPEDFGKLKFAEQVVAESMRLFPPAWTIGRLTTEPHRFGDFEIPKDSLILASQYVMHRDKRFWNDADEFKPERWSTLSIKEAGNKFVYFPFSKGVRSCIGEGFAWMEAVLLLAVFARKWRFELDPEQKIATQAMITLRPKFGMKMRITKR